MAGRRSPDCYRVVSVMKSEYTRDEDAKTSLPGKNGQNKTLHHRALYMLRATVSFCGGKQDGGPKGPGLDWWFD